VKENMETLIDASEVNGSKCRENVVSSPECRAKS
jgi:hypothetical protein